MAWTFFIYGVLPVLAFVVVDAMAPLRWAVVAAVLAAILDVLLTYTLLGHWDPFGIGAIFVFAGLGWWAVKTGDKTLVKLQPTIMAVLLATFLAYHQWFGPPLLETYMPMLQAAAPPDVRKMLNRPDMARLMAQSLVIVMIVLVLHGAACAFAAYKLSNGAWLGVRVLGFWGLLALAMVVQSIRLATGAP